MKFSILKVGSSIPTDKKEHAYLVVDNWDDCFEFSTMYSLYFVDSSTSKHSIGSVKIGQIKMKQDQRRPELDDHFESLNENYFSVGQDDSYYENLNNIPEKFRESILKGLKDIAFSEEQYKVALKEKVTKISLLRSVSTTSIKGQFRRMANGGARLTEYSFKYESSKIKDSLTPSFEIDFEVLPESNPPTNTHVLIGRNGVGKTHLINNMINCLLEENTKKTKYGRFTSNDFTGESIFSNVVSVTFSAFDETEPLPEKKDKSSGIFFSYVGLKRISKSGEKNLPPKSPVILKNEFVKSLLSCKAKLITNRWKRAITMLETDPVFLDLDIKSVLDINDEEGFKKSAGDIFKNLSSGHKIVLLTVTRLVETIEEKSLVFLDEPEAHLHPPLLSAFIRSLSDLLINRNGVAIIATHSPVVLQEVPQSCVWKLWRSGRNTKVERLEQESFGENVGVLTREVFGLELTSSGFHKMLSDSSEKYTTYKEALDSFENQLGMEAKAILRALYSTKESSN